MIGGRPRTAMDEIDEKVAQIDVWFDWSQHKVWYVTRYNAAGDTIGESEDFHLKSDAVSHAKDLRLAVAEQDGNAPHLSIGTRKGGM